MGRRATAYARRQNDRSVFRAASDVVDTMSDTRCGKTSRRTMVTSVERIGGFGHPTA